MKMGNKRTKKLAVLGARSLSKTRVAETPTNRAERRALDRWERQKRNRVITTEQLKPHGRSS
jgi:hypothetical protein